MIKINFKDSQERNFYNISNAQAKYFECNDCSLEYDEVNEVFYLYHNGDTVDENAIPDLLKL